MPTCPKCKHSFEPPATWRSYLSKTPGRRIHFYSTIDGKVTRTRLHYRLDIPPDAVRASLILVAAEHAHDAYFRWADYPPEDGETAIETIIRRM